MPQYDLDFAAKLAAVATDVDKNDPWAYDARRVTIYLSRLSAEISLKALLEQAGVPLLQIRNRSHDLRGLLKDVCECEVEVETAPGEKQWGSASCVRAAIIDFELVHVPIGEIIDAEEQGCSKYPNQIRYGETVIDFSPLLVSSMATVLAQWAKSHQKCIRVSAKWRPALRSTGPCA